MNYYQGDARQDYDHFRSTQVIPQEAKVLEDVLKHIKNSASIGRRRVQVVTNHHFKFLMRELARLGFQVQDHSPSFQWGQTNQEKRILVWGWAK